MFKLQKKDTIQWPVLVSIPQDGGRTVKAEFTATFKVLSKDRIRELVLADLDDAEQADLAAESLVGWDERLVDANDQPLPYGEEAKRDLLQITYVRAAVVQAFTTMSSGRNAARKNS